MLPVADHTPRPADRYVLTVRMEMIPVTVPMGMVSSSERLWRYLDEEIGDIQTVAALNRNGIRVGRGLVDDWSPVGRMLREMTGEALVRSQHLMTPGRAQPFPLRTAPAKQCIFAFNSRGELRGRDYPAGDNVFMITCRLNSDDPGGVLVQAAPMVKTDNRRTRYVKGDAGFELKTVADEAPVDGLEFTARVPGGHYLVIGPGSASRRATSPGNHFLITNERGLNYETLLVIVPQVYAAELPREGV